MPFKWINRDGRLIIAARSSWLFAQGMIAVILFIYVRQVGLDLVQGSLLVTAGTIGSMCYALIALFTGDTIGRRRFLCYLTAMRGVAGLALASTGSFPLLAGVCFLAGFSVGGAGGAIQPMAQAMLAETASPKRRTDLYAAYSITATIGTALGSLAAGSSVLLQGIFQIGETDSLRVLIFVYAVVNFAAAGFVALISPAVEVARNGKAWTNPLATPARGRIFATTGLFSLEGFATALVLQSIVAYWFFDRYGIRLQELAIIFFASNIGAAMSMWLGSRLANRLGIIKSMVFTRIPAAVLLIAIPFLPTAALAVAFWLIYSLTSRMAGPLRQSYSMAIVSPRDRVPMATMTGLGGNATLATGPTLSASLYAIASGFPFVAGGLVQMTGDILLYFAFRNVKPPEEAPAKAPAT